jgi:2,3,4,5-tetrahydropyridine-2,6-dicarboxylate N-succinyltransferase
MENLKQLLDNIRSASGQISHLLKKEFINKFTGALNKGSIRAAEPDGKGNWKVNEWVKEGILTLFRIGDLEDMSIDSRFKFFDKDSIPLRDIDLNSNVRLVPGGSSIRSGSYIAPGVICMPPMYINIGAYVDEGSMIDSHALVGTCAQIGKRVHLSAASQVGGVLEPSNARPVIIEDDVMIGGNCGIYEGVRVRTRAVLGSGVIMTASTRIYDIVNEKVISPLPGEPLEVPEAAVVIPGSRKINSDFGNQHGLSVSTPIIIKYRDAKTDAKTALNYTLR